MGVRREDIPLLARKAAMDPCLAINPRRIGPVEIEKIYSQVFN